MPIHRDNLCSVSSKVNAGAAAVFYCLLFHMYRVCNIRIKFCGQANCTVGESDDGVDTHFDRLRELQFSEVKLKKPISSILLGFFNQLTYYSEREISSFMISFVPP